MRKLNVLVVEDDAQTLSQLSRLLDKEGYTVIPASTGSEGLEKALGDHPDIIVTDLRLPGPSGLDILEAVRAKGNAVPLILVTAFGETDTALRAIRFGALDYLKKPIEIDDLLIALGRAREIVSRNKHLEEFPSLLLVEDDTASRRNLAHALRKDDYQVVEAEDGQQAVEFFKERKFDVVLLDIKMPRKDGIAAFEEMRAISDDFEAIILTGWGDEAAAIRALRLGAFGFTKKPIDLDELLLNIEQAIAKRSSDRALRYRAREVDLANQIIAQLVSNEDIVVNVSGQILQNACDRAATVLNELSDSVVIVDENRQVVFGNKSAQRRCGSLPVELDPKLIKVLADGDEHLESSFKLLLDGQPGRVETFQNKAARVTMSSAKLTRDGSSEQFVVIVSVASSP